MPENFNSGGKSLHFHEFYRLTCVLLEQIIIEVKKKNIVRNLSQRYFIDTHTLGRIYPGLQQHILAELHLVRCEQDFSPAVQSRGLSIQHGENNSWPDQYIHMIDLWSKSSHTHIQTVHTRVNFSTYA